MISRRDAIVTLLCATFATGCGLPLADAAASIENSCSADSDCGGRGICASLGGSRSCIAGSGELAEVQLEVLPSPTSSFGSNRAFLFDLTAEGVRLKGTKKGGMLLSFDRKLPDLVKIAGGISLIVADDQGAIFANPDQCAAFEAPANKPMDKSYTAQAKLEFQRVVPFANLLTDTYASETTLVELKPATPNDSTGTLWSFDIDLPPGTYDVYITPIQGGRSCPNLPPLLNAPVSIHEGVGAVNVQLGRPKQLTGTLVVPKDLMTLEKWRFDLLDAEGGRPISTTRVFMTPPYPDANGDRVVDLNDSTPPAALTSNQIYYYPPSNGTPILRLRPPEDDGRVVLWQLDNVLIGSGDAHLDLGDLALQPVNPPGGNGFIIGRVVTKTDATPIVASVTFLSKALTGSAAQNASFKAITQSGSDGFFKVQLVPGAYRVAARPTLDDGNAMVVEGEDEWRIDQTTQCCGRTLEAPPKTQLTGTGATPVGDPLADATVAVSPSLDPSNLYFTNQLSSDFLPRDASGLIGDDGTFSLGVDPGTFDFSVRPPPTSNFPWVVVPRIQIDSAHMASMGALESSFPVVLVGKILDPDDAPVVGATLRAWIPVSSVTGQGPRAVVPIGEAATSVDGSYVLVLPPSLTPSPTGASSP